jgi:hypothetical protein
MSGPNSVGWIVLTIALLASTITIAGALYTRAQRRKMEALLSQIRAENPSTHTNLAEDDMAWAQPLSTWLAAHPHPNPDDPPAAFQ